MLLRLSTCHAHALLLLVCNACLLSCVALQAMRLFVGVPVWTPHNRPQENNPSRAKYLESFGTQPVAAA